MQKSKSTLSRGQFALPRVRATAGREKAQCLHDLIIYHRWCKSHFTSLMQVYKGIDMAELCLAMSLSTVWALLGSTMET